MPVIGNPSLMSQPTLPRAVPEAMGVASGAILAFVEAVERDGLELHSLMLLRHGAVVAEGWWFPYAPEHSHMLFSLSKSFTATAVGFAVAEGKLALDDAVVSFFADDLPTQVSPNLAAMRVRDLLTMTTGHTAEPSGPRSGTAPGNHWARAFLAADVPYEPGTHFVYNTLATYMLSAIISKATGHDLLVYLTPRLLDPLGIVGATWAQCPHGIATGGFGLSIRTEDIVRFGQLYLQDGLWNGERILPDGWAAEATGKQVENGIDANNDWNQGYGFQFWRCRHNAYRGDGAFGQFCVVLPEQDAVVAITAGVDDMSAVLERIWSILLPAMATESLAENPVAHTTLTERLTSLALSIPKGSHHSPLASQISGKHYRFDANLFGIETATLDLDSAGGGVLLLHDSIGEHGIAFGSGDWFPGTFGFPALDFDERATLTTGMWIAEDTIVLKVCFVETPFVPTITCHFAGQTMTLDIRGSLGFGLKERPLLTGTLVSEAPAFPSLAI